jgi:polyisoprenyl-phosphate glycosyltransferase
MTPGHAGGMPDRREVDDVAIVVPVYRNAATLAELARRVAGALVPERAAYRLLFVVDASPDDSWPVVERLARADGRVGGILLARNQGQHRALIAGIREARARMVAIMDADLQDPPELLPALIDECERTAQTVFARRAGRYQSRGRMLTSRLFKSLLGALTGLPADVGTYFVVPAAVAERMSRAPVANVQLVVMAATFSCGWRSLRFQRQRRGEGVSAYSALGRARAAVNSLACAWQCRRLDRGIAAAPLVVAPVVARVNV